MTCSGTARGLAGWLCPPQRLGARAAWPLSVGSGCSVGPHRLEKRGSRLKGHTPASLHFRAPSRGLSGSKTWGSGPCASGTLESRAASPAVPESPSRNNVHFKRYFLTAQFLTILNSLLIEIS